MGSLTPCPGARLVVRRIPLAGAGKGALPGDRARLLEIGLVADDDDGNVLIVLDPCDFFPQHFYLTH